MKAPKELRIGISGWTYAPWRGRFFPKGLPQSQELAYASRQVSSIEINGTFYSLQTPQSYAKWSAQTPDDFVFAVKGPRFITHLRRLRDVRIPLANFFASGVLRLGSKLGPLLWQFPPSFSYDKDRLETFFTMLPRDTQAAAKLAAEHDSHVKQTWLQTGPNHRLRHAIEIRHESFCQKSFIDLLRRQKIALVVADTAGKWPFMEDLTADFVYVRLHGDEKIYVSGYTPAALAAWARKVRAWSKGANPRGTRLIVPASKFLPKGRDVFVYFDNDVKTRAPFDAIELARRVRHPTKNLKGTKMKQDLSGRKVAILVADGFEQVEMEGPKKALDSAGAQTEIVSPTKGQVKGWKTKEWGDAFDVDVPLKKADPERYDALLLPGGVLNPDKLRVEPAAVEFVKAFFEAGKPVAAICHGPQLLIEAEVVRGRKLTSFPSVKKDLVNAGAKWVDEAVVVDRGLVTSRKPDDIPRFNEKMVEEFAEGAHVAQAR